MKSKHCFSRILIVITLLAGGSGVTLAVDTVEQWGVYEIELEGPSEGNPFLEVQLEAVFDNGTKQIPVAGFYDGAGEYRIRFMPDTQGKWSYRTQSNRWELTGKSGELLVTQPSEGNHGPVRVVNTYHFAHADGTPFKQIGTTIYNWIDTPEALQEETVETLANSPFNKARMLLTQQPTPYRNEFVPVLWPYEGNPPRDWDFSKFNPEYFRNYEKRIQQLRDLGIEADIILFNPYGKFGFETLDAAEDERFVRYVIARFAAYRNIWWSLANEYDFLRTKKEEDWDRLGELVKTCDPYNHLRSIHNGKRHYNQSMDWVTHASVQDGLAVEVLSASRIYRQVWQKPIIFDEIKYEGDAKFRWADLDGFGMVHRFWTGMMGGTYVGHGDYFNTLDEDTWTSFGGKILGESVPRLAFLKTIMQDGPSDGIDPVDPFYDQNTAGKPGEYYLKYFGRNAPESWEFMLYNEGLREGMKFMVQIIDIWDMTVTPVEGEFAIYKKDNYYYCDTENRSIPLPAKPGIALRILRIPDASTVE